MKGRGKVRREEEGGGRGQEKEGGESGRGRVRRERRWRKREERGPIVELKSQHEGGSGSGSHQKAQAMSWVQPKTTLARARGAPSTARALSD